MQRKVAFRTCIAVVGVSSSGAFLSPVREQPLLLLRQGLRDAPAAAPYPPRGEVSLRLFGGLFKKNKGDGEEEEEKTATAESPVAGNTVPASTDEEETTPATTTSPFFATVEEDVDVEKRSTVKNEDEITAVIEELAVEVKMETDAETTSVEKREKEVPKPIEPVAAAKVEETPSPMSEVEKLRAQAARVRLEADKQQVQLTLEKIVKLNSKLARLKSKEVLTKKDQQSLEDVTAELLVMKAQLTTDERGEMKPVAPVRVAAKSASSAADTASSAASQSNRAASPSFATVDLDARVQQFEEAPEFMKVLVARTLGFDVNGDAPGAVERLNATDVVRKLYADELDYESLAAPGFADDAAQAQARETLERAYRNSGVSEDDKPVFTQEQIDAKVEELDGVPNFIKKVIDRNFNDTEMAITLLEEEYEEKQKKKKKGFFGAFGGKEEAKGDIGMDGEDLDRDKAGTFSRLFGGEPPKGASDLGFMMESLYPKSTRKEEETPEKRHAEAFLAEVVAPTKAFTPKSEPISVPGGWMIRGTNACDSGDDCIDKLDKRMTPRLREKISFFLLKDPFPDQGGMNFDPLDWPQVLFVAGPDVAREPALIARTALSAFGIASAWYGSIAPFLANPKLLDRATNTMELADAGMPTDLAWLSEMSIPLFLVFVALQLSHEAAHQVVAKARNFEVTVPTVVPSIMSGITGSITSLKTSPKNRQELVEFAVAGPLMGMVLSILVLCYGLILTATADPASLQMFPGLPLAILRQSTLGGGLIDIFLGNGVLNIPASSSDAAQALASTMISMHPLAVAGFVSLAVNALALVPAGRTDGGRIAMALFGRAGSQGVTFISLVSLFVLGVQSDLLLFYFAFIVFCQSELEIPMRNEIDEVDVPRVILASFAGFLMLLTIIPMS